MPTFSGIVVPTGSEASGRRTLLDIIDELSRPIDASDDTVRALAGDSFRAAVRVMNRKGMWPWEIQDEDVSMTASVAFSSVSSAIKKPLAMHYLNAAGGTRDQRISYTPYDKFVEKYDLDVSSEPYTYTIPNLFETGQIRWFPIPASADNLRFTFYRVTPAPRAEQETVEVPDHALETYMAYARLEMVKRLPAARSHISFNDAFAEARLSFRELSAHVTAPGDRSREVRHG